MKLRVIFRMSNAAGRQNFMFPENYLHSGQLTQSELLTIAKSPVYYRIAISRPDSN